MFDKRDNCFQASQRTIIKHLNSKGVNTNHKAIEKLFKDMSLLGITKHVLDVASVKRVMINPAFLSIKDFNNYYYMLAQFHLGSGEQAWQYVKVCVVIGWLFLGNDQILHVMPVVYGFQSSTVMSQVIMVALAMTIL
ncbi:hypothetical protein S140_234 [Shewanella sp. phage 1/40]|uniref:hypothetical protein n=1 Tax=Shewanella sp. phage 1/40 TaxID=1458860 RepID=UPI0004F5CA7E|nr:hypothetical protein S140_234 [Shewanella sp. phage 1/40]AHK11641.1 hypothetical protein S140_234 [Shewanella sp. phage 1/40]